MSEPVQIGQVVRGYCGGAFGRVYDVKRVEAIGYDWMIVRTDNGHPHAAFFDGPADLRESVERWAKDAATDDAIEARG